jgi:hypothetical protein
MKSYDRVRFFLRLYEKNTPQNIEYSLRILHNFSRLLINSLEEDV